MDCAQAILSKVDVKVSEFLDRLVFTPRDRKDDRLVRVRLYQSNPGIHFNRSAEGIWIYGSDVGKLNLNEVDLDIQWAEDTRKFIQNRQNAMAHAPTLLEGIKRIRNGGKDVAFTYLTDVNGLEVLDDHQWVNVACMTLSNSYGMCVFDEQGAGKTVTFIFAFDVLVERDEADFALIVAPKSMISEWPVDFTRFMNDRYRVQMIAGTRAVKRTDLASKADVIVTNFETAVTLEQELRAIIRRYDSRAVLVVDESFFTKNLDAKRTQAIRRLREYCGRAFVLCGTPAPNSPTDLVQQFNIVDFGITFDGITIPKNRQEAARIVQKVIEERGPFVRHLKINVLPAIPAKRFHRVLVPLQPQQLKFYKNTLQNLVTDLKSIDDATFERNKISFLARRSALLQICSNPVSLVNGYNEIPAKILALDKILESMIEQKLEKVVLWSFYTASLEAIFQRYAKYNPVRYDGTITQVAARREAVRRFKEDSDTMLFIGNPAAAGAGLNLQSARYAIYESMSNQAAHYLQSLDRIHRRGQKRDVEYTILLCDGTIETLEYNRLIEKERTAQAMLGDRIEAPVTRQTMLTEAILASGLFN